MKKFFIAATLLLIVGVATAFTVTSQKASTKPTQTQEWFTFNGVAGEENMPSKYTLVGSNPECPNTGNKRCAVLAYRQTGSSPVIPDLTASHSAYVKP